MRPFQMQSKFCFIREIVCFYKGNSLRHFLAKMPPPTREPPKLAYSLRGTPHTREAKVSFNLNGFENQHGYKLHIVVGTGGLAAARSRLRSNSPPDCYSLRSRRFATPTVHYKGKLTILFSRRARSFGRCARRRRRHSRAKRRILGTTPSRMTSAGLESAQSS